MGKKSVALLIVVIMCCTFIFTACNKDKYTNPVTGEEYILVTDENGNKVLSEDGELLVYATDEDGKKIKDDEGNYVTEIHGFIGQIENNGVIEDYAYYLTLPDGWKSVDKQGNFENKSKGYELSVDIQDETFDDCYKKSKAVFDATSEFAAKGEDAEAYWNEYEYDNIDTKAYMLSFKTGDFASVTMFFSSNNNLYILRIEGDATLDFEDVKAEMLKIFDGFKFKPYTYYEGLTDSPVKDTEKAE
ncbi:MAG: hypothetical protein IKK46_04750 [Clostridia bacterium]|nr:hypothetical protein [Clostridia bacterium]MBR3809596.1 hypothetical protein [Clostridia bacterium]